MSSIDTRRASTKDIGLTTGEGPEKGKKEKTVLYEKIQQIRCFPNQLGELLGRAFPHTTEIFNAAVGYVQYVQSFLRSIDTLYCCC